jgi:superoxide dismutase
MCKSDITNLPSALITSQKLTSFSTTGTVPVIGIDVWEHAYYLQYKNVRPDYLKAIWEVVDYAEAEARFLAAK